MSEQTLRDLPGGQVDQAPRNCSFSSVMVIQIQVWRCWLKRFVLVLSSSGGIATMKILYSVLESRGRVILNSDQCQIVVCFINNSFAENCRQELLFTPTCQSWERVMCIQPHTLTYSPIHATINKRNINIKLLNTSTKYLKCTSSPEHIMSTFKNTTYQLTMML